MKILVVDDEEIIVQGLISIISQFESIPFIVKGSDNVYAALDLFDELEPELIIIDINMPVMNGFDFIRQICQRKQDTKFLILTGHDEFDYARQAVRFKAVDYLLKPVDRNELYNVIEKVNMDILGNGNVTERYLEVIKPFIKEFDKQKLSYHLLKILDYIDKYYNKNISLTQLSEYSGLNANYICMLFKREMDISYLNYLDIVRLKRASYFLVNDHKKTIIEIAKTIGYQTERQLYKMFKKKIGITPNQFRELYGKQELLM